MRKYWGLTKRNLLAYFKDVQSLFFFDAHAAYPIDALASGAFSRILSAAAILLIYPKVYRRK